MEIRRVLRGEDTGFVRPSRGGERQQASGAVRPSTDRLELSRQWVERMEERRIQAQGALLTGAKEKQSNGILDLLEEPDAESQELDALSEQMKSKMKCLEIAMRIMKGKKVPPEDEQYLMENDPEGYKLAMAMKVLVKQDKEQCESVLEDEDKKAGRSAQTGDAAPAEGGEAPSGEGDAPASGGEAAE